NPNSVIDEQIMKDARDNIASKIQNPELIEEASAQAQTDLNDYTSESEAILLFNQGRSEEAIRIYEKLIEQNPQKASYYRSQINVLIEVQNTLSELTKTNPGLPVEDTPLTSDVDLNEDLSERMAIQLFNQGKTTEAVEVYKKLIEKFPDKKTYFLSQIEILES
ncbi:MAG: tetratricopeptide repeat protein, partial [Bacteroidota bacterium]